MRYRLLWEIGLQPECHGKSGSPFDRGKMPLPPKNPGFQIKLLLLKNL
jgi:hypothetical protein